MKKMNLQKKMEIRISSNDNYMRVNDSLERIFDKITKVDLSIKIKSTPIVITDDNDALKIYKKIEYTPNDKTFIKGFSDGPGAVRMNILLDDMKYHLIVINLKNCDNLGFGELELDGVICHELGHIFNKFIPHPSLSALDAFKYSEESKDENINFQFKIDKQKLENQSNAEFYADYFSKKTNCSEGLISSIELTIASDLFLEKNELFIQRLNKLRSDESFDVLI